MSVPKGFEGLLANLVVCCGVHEKHAKKHDVTSDATSLSVMNLYSSLGSNLRALNVEKAGKSVYIRLSDRRVLLDIMGRNVDDGIDEKRVRDLSVKPL